MRQKERFQPSLRNDWRMHWRRGRVKSNISASHSNKGSSGFMDGILDRNGQAVKLSIISSAGQSRDITSAAEFKQLLGGIKSNLPRILARAAATGNIRAIATLGKIFVKKYALNKKYDERHELLNTAFDISSVRVERNGKSVTFTQGGFLLFALIDEIFVKNQYDVSAEKINGKVVVDAGANLGTFSLLCATLGAKKVYAFEPVAGTYEMLKKNVEDNGLQDVVIPVNKALGEGNYTSKIKCDYSGDGGSSIAMRKDERKDTLDISVVSLDSFFASGERVDFIKMDVEGFEENALTGAKSTISKFKPAMSLSAYHKPTDKEAIPRLILGMRPDYNIVLNNFYEEDFYCD